MSDNTITRHGNCHCGSYRFELDGNVTLDSVTACPCSLCKKQGFLWLGLADNVLHVTRDDGELMQYSTQSVEQEFCSTCGTAVYGRHHEGELSGRKLLNVRTLRGVNHFDHDLRKPVDEEASSLNGVFSVPATGSCHCGDVSVRLLSAPEPFEIKEDNCSICTRNAFVGVYPDKNQVEIRGDEHTREYRFGRKFNGSPFCKTCGVHVFSNLYGPPQEVVDRLPKERQAMVEKMLRIKPLNVRTFDDVDVSAINVVRDDTGTEGYESTVLGLGMSEASK